MADGWYYSLGGERKGPVDDGALRILAEHGVLTGDTPVWREGMPDWEPAFRHVPGLVPSAPAALPTRIGGSAEPGSARRAGAPGGRDYEERVGMGEAFRRFWSGFVDFSGRSNRGEYWWATLAVMLVGIVASLLDGALFGPGDRQPLSGVWGLATLLPSLAIAVRRLHDVDRTGWWVVAPAGLGVLAGVLLVSTATSGTPPVAAVLAGVAAAAMAIVLLVWCCQRGTSGPNRFG